MAYIQLNVAYLIAILAFGVGAGELLMCVNTLEIRRWGRAVKLMTPVFAGGIVAISVAARDRHAYHGSGLGHGWGLGAVAIAALVMVVTIRLSETRVLGYLLKPTE